MMCLLQQDEGHAMAWAHSHWPFNAEGWVQIQASPCVICGGQSGNGTVLQFSLVSDNSPMLNTHLYTYQQCYTISAVHSIIK
jgi:hypothetical protein